MGPSFFPRPGNGAGLKAPGSNTPHPLLQRCCSPSPGSQPQAMVWGRRSPKTTSPCGNTSGPRRAEPQPCTAVPRTALSIGQLRMSWVRTRPTGCQEISPTDVWHHPLLMSLSRVTLKQLSCPHAGCGAGQNRKQQGQPILGLRSPPHKMQPLLPASQRGSVHYPLQSAPRSSDQRCRHSVEPDDY